MKTIITFNQKEKDTIERTIEILNEYSRVYSASVYGKKGIFHDTAASAAGMLESLINKDKEVENETNND